jgi:hypothetical protein
MLDIVLPQNAPHVHRSLAMRIRALFLSDGTSVLCLSHQASPEALCLFFLSDFPEIMGLTLLTWVRPCAPLNLVNLVQNCLSASHMHPRNIGSSGLVDNHSWTGRALGLCLGVIGKLWQRSYSPKSCAGSDPALLKWFQQAELQNAR